MADFVIPPKTTIVKCGKCETLYVPDKTKNILWYDETFKSFEKCPICGCDSNNYQDTIPLWKYNLIKWRRGGFRGDKRNQRSDS